MNQEYTPNVMGELIADRAKKLGEKVFLRYKDESYTYNEINQLSNRYANAFIKQGIEKNNKVSFMLPNCPELLLLWFGAAKIGAVEVPVNTSYKGEFLYHIVDQSDSRILAIIPEYIERVIMIQDRLKKVEKLLIIGDFNADKLKGLKIPVLSLAEFIDAPDITPDIKIYPSDPHAIIYTSGTTGLSKGALAPHKFWIVCAQKMLEYREGTKDDIFYTFMPLYHFNAQCLTTVTALIAGAEMILADKFSASRFWDDIRKYGATQFNYLGAVIPILIKQPEKENDRDNPVRIALGGGCPQNVMEIAEERFGIKCLEGYGMSEIGIPIHIRANDRRPGSCGKALDIYEIKIVDEDDNEVENGEPGEIIFRPKEPFTMMLEYYNMPDKTLEAYRNLWFHTGDLAKKDEEGFYYFVDRKKDSLRRRGENISSFEVEKAINTHPSVLESAAVAVASELAEDEVKICIVLQPDCTLSAEDLIYYANERMPYFAVPRYVEFMESLPKTPTERIQKYVLRQAGVNENTWDREEAGIKVTR
ncbi:AMP-binding enzyme [Desulfosarcina cetonica]|uniref:AMP-binding protein n=1 Tax=Desulfosarcina cetonica TaxID=90730 RepID=UPI000AFDCE46|nr:AMP-binding protein [Desulfosarcina cetonica]VTR67880.1 AMP-binding enzyme [Desulfosarcina cetonica]